MASTNQSVFYNNSYGVSMNDILKYIAPHFYLNVNRTIEDE